jgi:CMP-N-acetylneuraminic acid synthetase
MIAVVPARLNSKRVNRKNLRRIGPDARPMLWYTLDAAHRARDIDRIVVTSEADEVLESVERWALDSHATGKLMTVIRPSELSADDVTAYDAAKHALDSVSGIYGQGVDGVLMLLPTSPLREARHINDATAIWRGLPGVRVHMDSVCIRTRRKYRHPHGVNIQRVPSISYEGNGAIRVGSWADALDGFTTPGVPYIMDPISGLDVDTEADLELANKLLHRASERVKADVERLAGQAHSG